MGKDKDKNNIWEWMGYRDRDFDGDVDINDVLIEDHEHEELMKKLYPDTYRYSDEDDDDFDCDFDEDDDLDDDSDSSEEFLSQKIKRINNQLVQTKNSVVASIEKMEGEEAWSFYWQARKGECNKILEAVGELRFNKSIKKLEDKLSLSDKKYQIDYPDKTTYRQHLEIKLAASQRKTHEGIYRMSEEALKAYRKSILEDGLGLDESEPGYEYIQEAMKKEVLEVIESRLFDKKPYMKYYNEMWGSWHIAKAMMDNFPELKENYDYDYASDTFELDILCEAYEISPERAMKYFEWIIDFFPTNEVQKTESGTKDFIYCTLYFFSRVITDTMSGGDDFLYKYLKRNKRILDFLMNSIQWQKHELYPLENFMQLFERNKDYAGSKAIYEAYLKNQYGKYSDRDLGQFWKSRINEFSGETIDAELYDLIEGALSWLGEFGTRPRKDFKEVKKSTKRAK